MISISDLRTWITCPAKLRYAQERVPISISPSLDLGTVFHSHMERRWQKALGRPVGPITLPQTPESTLEWQKLEPHATAWKPPSGWAIRDVELPLRGPLARWDGRKPDHDLVGRLDALIEWNQKLWSLQYKTCGSSVPLDNLAASVRMSFHEAAYQHLVETTRWPLGAPFGGTILLTAKKLSQKSLTAGQNPIALHYLTRTPAEQKILLTDLSKALDSMETSQPFKNWESCFGPFKNSKCPFFPVCHEGISLHSPLYMPTPNRYPDLDP